MAPEQLQQSRLQGGGQGTKLEPQAAHLTPQVTRLQPMCVWWVWGGGGWKGVGGVKGGTGVKGRLAEPRTHPLAPSTCVGGVWGWG